MKNKFSNFESSIAGANPRGSLIGLPKTKPKILQIVLDNYQFSILCLI